MKTYCLSFYRNYRYVRTVVAFLFEHNFTVDQSVQCMVFAHANTFSRVVLGTTLANDDVTGDAGLTSEDLNA